MKSIHFWFPWILSLSSTNLTIFSPYHWLSTLNPPCRQRLLLCRRRLEHFAGQVRSTQQFECAIVQACRDVPGWMSASPAAVECCWVCAPVPRYFAQAQPNETFVVCRLSSVALIATHLSFAKARQGSSDAAKRRRCVPERLSDCGLTQVSPACAGSRERGTAEAWRLSPASPAAAQSSMFVFLAMRSCCSLSMFVS